MEEATDPSIKDGGGVPEASYEKQLSVFEEDTLKEVEAFRAARSAWLAETKKETLSTNSNVRLNHSNIYNGRCRCLRRIRLKTTGLRVHFQTLRPKIFYTLRPKITSLAALEEKKRAKTELEKCLNDKEWAKTFQKDYLGSDAELQQKEQEKKKKKVECPQVKTPGPCEKAMKKLKASSYQSRVIESCQCDDGKEVTVVIKGFCLCDKTSLNNIRFDRVRERYSKLTTVPYSPEEVNFPSTKNSLELYRKQLGQKSAKSTGKDQELGKAEAKSFLKKSSLESYKKQVSQKSLKSIREEQELDRPEFNFPSIKSSVELYKKRLSQKLGRSKVEKEEIDPFTDSSKKAVRFKLTEDIPKVVHKECEEPDAAEDHARNEMELKRSTEQRREECDEMKKTVKTEKKDQKKLSPEEIQNCELGLHQKTSEELKEKIILVIEGEDKFPTQIPKVAESQLKDELKPYQKDSGKGEESTITLLKTRAAKQHRRDERQLDVKYSGEEEESSVTVLKTRAAKQVENERKLDAGDIKKESITAIEKLAVATTNEPKPNVRESKKEMESSNVILKPTAELETKEKSALNEKQLKEEDKEMKFSVIRLNVAESQPGEPAGKAKANSEEKPKEISIGDIKVSKRKAVTLPRDNSEEEEGHPLSSEQSHVDGPQSLLSLYKNVPEEQSSFNLTVEQYEKTKKNLNAHDGPQEKTNS